MRFVSYEDIKKEIHEQGLTIEKVAYAMRVSPRTLKRMFNREVDPDTLSILKNAIKEALLG